MSTTKDNYNLLTWLTHIKHLHDVKKAIPLLSNTLKVNTAPVSSTLTAIHKQPSQESDTWSIKKKILFQKENLIRFHRPHGLFLKKPGKKEDAKGTQQVVMVENECSCCAQGCCSGSRFHRHSTSSLSNMDDDELEEEELDRERSRSMDGTRLPPCMCPMDHEEEDDVSSQSPRRSRESSIHALPGELDSPEVGFKQLQKDGDLVDYDDISDLTDDAYLEYFITNVQSHSRSAVHNSLIRLALNG